MIACLEQIDFAPGEVRPVLVVDGVIFAGIGPHTIQLSTTDRLGLKTFPQVTDATVTLINDRGLEFSYNHVGEGNYRIQAGSLNAKTGEVYFIEIQYEGQIYRSMEQQIPEPQSIDNLSFDIEEDNFILEAHNTTPDNGAIYLKWNVENVYSITELICNPFISPLRCYIKDEFHMPSIPLLDGSRLQKGTTFKHKIASKRIDFTFGNPQSFYVIQQSMSPEAFEYWSRIDLVSNQLGTLFDPQPSSVRGNIYNINDPTDIVLGYFAAVAQDDAVLFTAAGDFFDEFQILPYCGIPGFEIFARGCCRCTDLENSSLNRPPYW